MFNSILTVLIGLIALLGAGVFSYTYLEDRFGPVVVPMDLAPHLATGTVQTLSPKNPPETTRSFPAKTKVSVPMKVVQKEAVAPGPLREKTPVANSVPTSLPSVVLTPQGVLEYTNRARAENGGFGALTQNATLDRVATAKLLDMFSKQYFEHISPTGVGPSDLAKTTGYAYVVVGENLALGNFANDSKLVDAWMASPGHRANILNPRYQEIGIAAGRGMYEGRETWLAVQSFGMPLSACPVIDTQKKIQIETNDTTIANMRVSLDLKKAQIEATQKNDPNYNVYVNEFNAIVESYNPLVELNRILVEEYNLQVRAFNTCAIGTAEN